MTGFLFVLALVLAVGAAYLLLSRVSARPKYLAAAEYWVYLPQPELPDQERIMDRVIKGNPFAKRGVSPITPREGLLFSDVRLHIALVLRRKNPHVFRPDLFDEHIEPSPTILRRLSESQALAKVRYLSEEPLPDERHLMLLPYLAEAISELGGGHVIYDASTERLIEVETLRQALHDDANAARPDLHVRIVWKDALHGGWAETRGLIKIGLPELATDEVEADQRVLVTAVLEEAAREVWRLRSIPDCVEVHCFDDGFQLHTRTGKAGQVSVSILRLQNI